jgi:hypothetical protein
MISFGEEEVDEILVIKVAHPHEIHFSQQIVDPLLSDPLAPVELVQQLHQILTVYPSCLSTVDVEEQVPHLLLELLLESGSSHEVGKGAEGELGGRVDVQAAIDLGQHGFGYG